MKSLDVEATKSTPKINFDIDKKVLSIEGQSYPEDAAKFYQQIFEWIRRYLADETKSTTVELKVSYMNTSSSKCMMTMLDMLEEAYKKGKQITVNWRYDTDNEMAYECGLEFEEDLKLPFNIIEENE